MSEDAARDVVPLTKDAGNDPTPQPLPLRRMSRCCLIQGLALVPAMSPALLRREVGLYYLHYYIAWEGGFVYLHVSTLRQTNSVCG